MRTIRRTIILLGCAGFIALYLLQLRVALAATPLLLVVGMLAGLVSAKWLPWAWYGRQFAAGVRAGVAACGLAAAGVLLSLIGDKKPQVTAIAAASHVPGLDLAGIVTSLGAVGWFVPYLLLTAFFAVAGVLLAGLVAQIAGWNKSQRTVRVIREAHNSASLLHRNQTWAPASNSIPSVGGYWNSVLPSSGPASHPGMLAAGAAASAANGHSGAGRAPISGGSPARARSSLGAREGRGEQAAAYLAPLPPLDFELSEPLDHVTPPPALPDMPDVSEPIPPRRSYSGAQPIPAAMDDDLRKALDQWDDEPTPDAGASDDSSEDTEAAESGAPKKSAAKSASVKPKTPTRRQPKASAYLNSDPPTTPRRNRKKQNTRDWLC